MMPSMRAYNLDGCGGCQLSVLSIKPDIVALFDIVEFLPEDTGQKAGIGLAIGHFDEAMLHRMQDASESLIICGACANESYDEIIAASECLSAQRVYRARGCPLTAGELIGIIHCIVQGIKPTEKNAPVCMECKAKENVCLLLKGYRCQGPVTRAGCDA
ncbi:MAG: hypothetical protein AAGU77_14300, partial [Bacillota bacterium]